MKIIAMLGAGLLAVGTLGAAAVPTAADAQRHGWNDRHGGYRDHGRGWRGDRGYRDYRGGYRQRGYGYRGGGYRRGRVVCRVHRGYRGPVRTCFRR